MREEIKVRKPRFPKWIGLSSVNNRYTKRWYKWQQSLPNNGEKIKLTWLPNPRNNPSVKSCYIGCEGVVHDMDKEEGSFSLYLDGAWLVHPSGNFNYIKL